MNLSLVCNEMLVTYDTHRVRSLIEQKSKEVDLGIKELQELAEKLNISNKSKT